LSCSFRVRGYLANTFQPASRCPINVFLLAKTSSAWRPRKGSSGLVIAARKIALVLA
jgi:hypothetical protein